MDTMLATNADAQLILKLYELRTEAIMREARTWVTREFWPDAAREVLNINRDFASPYNAHLRQVVSYWEMAAAFVLHGALDAELFLDCNPEALFVLAKFYPFLREIRVESPNFLMQTEELTLRFSSARQRLELLTKELGKTRPAYVKV